MNLPEVNMKKIIFLIIAALPAGAYAGGAGTTAAPFLKAAMSPRALAMGGAFGALADDSGAVFVNPAGLAQSDKAEAGMDFSTYLQDARMGNFSYARGSGGKRMGLGFTFMTVDGIEKRGLGDSAGVVPSLGNFGANDMAVSLAYAAREIAPAALPGLDGGFAVKVIRSEIDSKSAVAVAVDAGAIYKATPKLNLSLALQNLGTGMKFDEESDPLPLNLRAGLLYKATPNLNAVAEVNEYINDEQVYPALGCEYWFRGALALRAGYKFGYDTANLGNEVGLSLGFGVKVQGIGVDYAYLPFGDLGNIHRFGFWLQF